MLLCSRFDHQYYPSRTCYCGNSCDDIGVCTQETDPLLPNDNQTQMSNVVKAPAPKPKLVADMSFSKQLCTPEFLFVYIFCCTNMFRSNMFLGTAGNFLLSLGDAQHHDLYATFLASIIPVGFVFVPLISYFLDTKVHSFLIWVLSIQHSHIYQQ